MIFQSKTGLRNTAIALLLIIVLIIGLKFRTRPRRTDDGNYYVRENYVVKEHTYSTPIKEFEFHFDDIITENGKQYKLLDEKREIINESPSEPYTYETTQTGRTLEEIKPEKTIIIDYHGRDVECTLSDIQYDNASISREPITVTAFNRYEKSIGRPQIPEKKEIDYYDEISKTTTRVVCNLDEVVIEKEARWVNDFQAPLTFHVYGADYYTIGQQKIPHNDDRPLLEGKDEQILDLLGLSSSLYRIEHYKWKGGVYEEDGEEKRDAIAYGSRLVTDYRANYSNKNVVLPDVKGVIARIRYVSRENLTGINYNIRSTGIYAPVNNTLNYLLGAFLLLIFIVLTLYLIAASDKRRGEK